MTARCTIAVAGTYVAANRSFVPFMLFPTTRPADSMRAAALVASRALARLWTYVLMRSIAVQSASTLTSRAVASPTVLCAVAEFAAAAAWIKARKAAIVTGSEGRSPGCG